MSHTFVSRAALVVMSAAALCLSAPRAHSQDFAPTPEPTAEPTYQYLVKATPTPEGEELQAAPEPESESAKTTPMKSPSVQLVPMASSARVNIYVFGTPDTSDDVVRYQNGPKEGAICTFTVEGLPDSQTSQRIVFTSPDDKIKFRGSGSNNELVLNWPRDRYFYVDGVVKSGAVGDSAIHAHIGYANGRIVGTARMTVFYLDDAKVAVTRGRDYALQSTKNGLSYTSNGAQAVNMYARISVKPSGLNLDAPYLRNLRIGLSQTARNVLYQGNATVPRAEFWNPNLPKGYKMRVPRAQGDIAGFQGSFIDGNEDGSTFLI